MISRVLIIASGGLLAYSKNLIGNSSIHDDLIGGFLTAISNFVMEIKGGEVKSLNFRNFNYIYSHDMELDCMFVLVTDIDDLEEEARYKIELLKKEFVSRYRKQLENWTGEVSVFEDFDEYVERNLYIPPKILLVGEPGVGKTSILNLFPGETVLELDEDLIEIIQKPVKVSEFSNIKEVVLREIDLEELIKSSKLYRQLLDSVDIICIITNSAASNLARTKKSFLILKSMVKKADYYIIANFQDLKDTSFKPSKIQEVFGEKTYGLSCIGEDAKKKLHLILKEMIEESILEKIAKKQFEDLQ